MFPPIDDAVLKNNPDFAALYNTLTTAILNPNGSTKHDASAKERDAVREVTAPSSPIGGPASGCRGGIDV